VTVVAVTPLDRAGVRPSSRRTARTAGRRARAPSEPYYGVIARRQSWTAATAMPSPEHTLRGAAALLRRNSWALRGGCSSRFGTAPCSLPLKSVAATCSPGGLQVAERSGLRDIATTDIYESIVAAVPAGEWGDYGRLWAWRSMAGLSGAPAGVSAEEVERQVRQSTWFRLEGLCGLVPQRHRRRLRHSGPLPRLPPDCRAGGDGHRLEIQPDRRPPPDTICADWAEGDGDGASARRTPRSHGGCSGWGTGGERSGTGLRLDEATSVGC
jgi:hypothetical protein